MRRSGYNSLSNSEDHEGPDSVDSAAESLAESEPFAETRSADARSYKRTLCLVFTLFFGGFVSELSFL